LVDEGLGSGAGVGGEYVVEGGRGGCGERVGIETEEMSQVEGVRGWFGGNYWAVKGNCQN
jgi:hypothetical protein